MSDEELHLRFNEAAKKYYPSKPASNTVKSDLIEYFLPGLADPRRM